MDDCLFEAHDMDALKEVLRRIEQGEIELLARDTREPSPFSYELINANPYAFLDGGEVAERRARAVSTRRSLSVESVQDLGRLDPEAISQVILEAQPFVRNADELHDALLSRIIMPEIECLDWREFFADLKTDGRATLVTCVLNEETRNAEAAESTDQVNESRVADSTTLKRCYWAATERIPAVMAAFPTATLSPPVKVVPSPESLSASEPESLRIRPVRRWRLWKGKEWSCGDDSSRRLTISETRMKTES